jgi:transcriptional regulator with XRE-family HTH domain
MANAAPPSTFNADFIARTKLARERAGLTQEAIATILRIKQDTYKQYETRSPLPHRFIPAFCAATHIEERWLFTGRARRAASIAAE